MYSLINIIIPPVKRGCTIQGGGFYSWRTLRFVLQREREKKKRERENESLKLRRLVNMRIIYTDSFTHGMYLYASADAFACKLRDIHVFYIHEYIG